MGKRELVAFLNLSSWCLVMVMQLFLAVPRGCLRFVIVVFPDHTHLLFTGVLTKKKLTKTIDCFKADIEWAVIEFENNSSEHDQDNAG